MLISRKDNKIKLDIRSLTAALEVRDNKIQKIEDLVLGLEKKLKSQEDQIEKLKRKNEKLEQQILEVNTEDLEERLSENEREFENFREISKQDAEATESKMSMYFNSKLDKLTKAREAEILIIEDENGKIESTLKKIESKINGLESEYTKLTAYKPRKRQVYIDCNKCDKSFKSHSALEKHLQEKHVMNALKKCNVCQMEFQTKWRLSKHMEVHLENARRRKCHYFNAGKVCPFEALGCKFVHEISDSCKFGKKCQRHMCQFRH